MIALLADTISEMKNFKRNALSGSTSLDDGKTGVNVKFKDECNTLLGLCRKTGHGVPRPGINSQIKNIITRMNIENQLSGKIINKAKETLITFINSSLYYRDGQKCEVHRQIAEKMIKGEMLRAEDNSILLKLRNS